MRRTVSKFNEANVIQWLRRCERESLGKSSLPGQCCDVFQLQTVAKIALWFASEPKNQQAVNCETDPDINQEAPIELIRTVPGDLGQPGVEHSKVKKISTEHGN